MTNRAHRDVVRGNHRSSDGLTFKRSLKSPLRSGTVAMVYGTEVLSLVNTGHKDGILQASEIFNLELNADLMTLSQPIPALV